MKKKIYLGGYWYPPGPGDPDYKWVTVTDDGEVHYSPPWSETPLVGKIMMILVWGSMIAFVIGMPIYGYFHQQ